MIWVLEFWLLVRGCKMIVVWVSAVGGFWTLMMAA
jgi:hypothetical protein